MVSNFQPNQNFNQQVGQQADFFSQMARGSNADIGSLLQQLAGNISQIPTGFDSRMMPQSPGGAGTGTGLQQQLSNLGWSVDPATQFMGNNSAVLPTYPTQSPIFSRDMGATFPISGGVGDFGFGAPGEPVFGQPMGTDWGVFTPQNAVDRLMFSGMPIPPFLNDLAGMSPTSTVDTARAVDLLGNVDLPSPQFLSNLDPSAMAFLAGFFETVLGIPWADIMSASSRPYRGLRNAPVAR